MGSNDDPIHMLGTIEKETPETREHLAPNSLRLKVLIRLSSTKKLYHQSHSSHRA